MAKKKQTHYSGIGGQAVLEEINMQWLYVSPMVKSM